MQRVGAARWVLDHGTNERQHKHLQSTCVELETNGSRKERIICAGGEIRNTPASMPENTLEGNDIIRSMLLSTIYAKASKGRWLSKYILKVSRPLPVEYRHLWKALIAKRWFVCIVNKKYSRQG